MAKKTTKSKPNRLMQIPTKAPKFIGLPKILGFNRDALAWEHLKPCIEHACLFIEPGVESFGNMDKGLFDRLPDLVDELVDAEREGEDQDEILNRWNDERPAMDLKGRALDWRKVLSDALPLLISMLGEILKPKV